MHLTKTDFILYLNCPKSFWLKKRRPEDYPYGEFTTFMKKLTREGREVERYVDRFFEERGDRSVSFQTVYESDDGLMARADVVERTGGGETILYEVKSSTRVKTDRRHNHLKDACFQKLCAERAGQRIDRVVLVHLNGTYVRAGEINPAELLVFEDITERVEDIAGETIAEIDAALALLASKIDLNGCSCLENSRANHCDTFQFFNPGIPTPSIYSLPRLSEKKRLNFLSRGVFGLEAVADDFPLSEAQRLVVRSAKTGEPQIDPAAVRAFLSQFAFPLYFFDYETYASAVPMIDGASPHRHFPVQYSLHVLERNGDLSHREYLEREARMPLRLIEHMRDDIGPEGSLVSWHASFEKTQNKNMAEDFPEHADFLRDLNDRMVDLEKVFKTGYVDARFDGSTSIKKVLPVICPHLDYGEMDVQNGAAAMEAWERMIHAGPDEAEVIATQLLSYCELDTFAMVEIYRFLAGI